MSKRNKIIFTILLILAFVAFIGYQYVYQKHRDISNEKASYEITINDLNSEYSLSWEKANQKFLDKTILITGVVTSIDKTNQSYIIDEKINCNSVENIKVNVGSIVSVKGRFIGYDELLEEYKLDECSIVK